MPLNKSKGNMYPFITHTWNPVKGVCQHECSYCYVDKIRARFKLEMKPPRLVDFTSDELGAKNRQIIKRIFVGSAIDIFAEDIPGEWIAKILDCCNERKNNHYLFQTKNPGRYFEFIDRFPIWSVLVTTLESNREYPKIYNLAPPIKERFEMFAKINRAKMVTIEPILDFDTYEFVSMILKIDPSQVNIGADTGNNHLPEPPAEKVLELIAELEKFTKVYQKPNLRRLLKERNRE